jgi:predicted enzyme related to lactoylglutathione lyase
MADLSGTAARTYPHGVPCWIDLEVPDVDAALAFYGPLFGWRFTEKLPPGAPGRYVLASLDGTDATAVVAIATPRDGGGDGDPAWCTYLAVDDVAAAATQVTALGGTVLGPAETVGPPGDPAGTLLRFRDPQGAESRLWQAGTRLGAQRVNEPGTWNFSNLLTGDQDAALAFYGPLLGWTVGELGYGMVRVKGYGAHLAATVDPGNFERQEFVPEGFADVVAGIGTDEGPARWSVAFTVADRDVAVRAAVDGGATVLATQDTEWTKDATVRDPFGAELVLSQFDPPESFLEAESDAQT